MSRLRNAFRRQDSSLGGAVAAAPTLDHSTSPSPSLNDGKDGEELELADAKTGTVDPPPYQHHADEHRPADPSALELDELDPENKLANGRERPIEVRRRRERPPGLLRAALTRTPPPSLPPCCTLLPLLAERPRRRLAPGLDRRRRVDDGAHGPDVLPRSGPASLTLSSFVP